MQAVILGCGYTGSRVAHRLLRRGFEVTATARDTTPLAAVAGAGAETIAFEAAGALDLSFVKRGSLVLYSIPTLQPDPIRRLLAALSGRVARVVYLSSTGVYGSQTDVDHTTPRLPAADPEIARAEAEDAVAAGPWTYAILRAAAIYGPGRGIHESMRSGKFRLVGDGSNWVSRIHVEDLAALSEAALLSGITGAWPVADERPCPQREIAAFCASLLNVAMPEPVPIDKVHHTRRANRRVDGSEIRRLLSVPLQFPGYEEGIRHALESTRGIQQSSGTA